jgi:hypothetical protein
MFAHDINSEFILLTNNVVKEVYDPSLPKSALNLWQDKSEGKIYTCNFVKQQEAIDRWVDLILKFEHSFEEKIYLFADVSSDKVRNDFRKALGEILSMYPEIITAGASDDECVCIYFEKDNKSVYFDLFFESGQETEACVTVFENKVSKCSFTDYLEGSISKVRNEFDTANE